MSPAQRQPQAPDPDELLTYRQTADLLKVDVATVRRWIMAGRLPAYRLGPQTVRVRRGDVHTLLTPVQSGKVGEAL